MRLVDGIIENEGRIEMCINGVWGAICDEGWDITDAHVACTQMGYPRLGAPPLYVYDNYNYIKLEPIPFYNSSFGDGKYPIVYSNLACKGWETNLRYCGKEVYPQSSCPRSHVAGVLCGHGT